MSQEACWKYARVVDDDQITRLQKRRQHGDLRMNGWTCAARQVQKTGAAPFGRRILRDELVWQLEIKIADEHAVRDIAPN